MILDSSAIVAITCRESGHEMLLERLGTAPTIGIAAPTVFEAAMVLTIKLKQDGLTLVHELLRTMEAQILPFTDEYATAAYHAYIRFGKGRHPAGLNFGDCVSYSAAKLTGQPLLFVGNDFGKTDLLRS
jgi:ribonuclease VapC